MSRPAGQQRERADDGKLANRAMKEEKPKEKEV
jgi:hypothetical protein